jgi:hypothetical protein
MRLQLASSLLLWLWLAAIAHVKAWGSGDHTEGVSVSISDAPARAVSQVVDLSSGRRAVATEAATVFAKRVQCWGLDYNELRMPCPNRTAKHVFHAHISKMAGRTMMEEGPGITGLPNCEWYTSLVSKRIRPYVDDPPYVRRLLEWSWDFWSREDEFRTRASAHQGDPPCFASYETGWDAAASFGDGVVVVTMLRSTVPWLLSAVHHNQHKAEHLARVRQLTPKHKAHRRLHARLVALGRRGHRQRQPRRQLPASPPPPPPPPQHAAWSTGEAPQGLDELLASGCFERDAPAYCTQPGKNYPYPGMMVARLGNGDYRELKDKTPLWLAAAHLESAVFGLVEFMQASTCLMKWQFGQWTQATAEQCDCRTGPGKSSGATMSKARAGMHDYSKSPMINQETLTEAVKLMGRHESLYAFARSQFLLRAAFVSERTGVLLVC